MKFYYDLHIHSALSPCGDKDMTPNNIVNMSALCGLSVIAVTDHNTCGNIAVIEQLAKKSGILLLPGIELETQEEIHVVCYFPSVEAALDFEREQIVSTLPNIKNDEDIFGEQLLFDENDNVIGKTSKLLINATGISIEKLPFVISSYNGAAVPAHIDKSTKSIISVLGMVDPDMGFSSLELSHRAAPNFLKNLMFMDIDRYNFLYSSDAHYLCDINDRGKRNFFELDRLDSKAVIAELSDRRVM